MNNKNQSKITLWTIQPIEWYERLLTDKIIYGDAKLSEWYTAKDIDFRTAYDWLIAEMKKQISPRPFADAVPIWAWFHYLNSDKKRPDLRSSGHLEKGQKGVRIEFIKSRNKVLLSDFDLWHSVLNYWCISDNEKQSESFDKLLRLYNVKFNDKENYPPIAKQMIMDSWQKVLDMHYCPEYSANPFEKKSIQATFWNLSVDEIIKVDEFVAR